MRFSGTFTSTFTCTFAFLATLLASSSAQATTNLIVDGSFEARTQAAHTSRTYGSIAGWTVGAKGVELRNNVAGTAADGVNFVELDTTANSWISQTVQTVAGENYVLTFEIENRPGVALSSQGITVTWGSTVLGKALTSSLSSGWQTYTYDLLGDGTATTLTFAAAGKSDSLGSSLDNVSLVSSVPEPDTYAMLLAGLGLVGFVARRHKASKATAKLIPPSA